MLLKRIILIYSNFVTNYINNNDFPIKRIMINYFNFFPETLRLDF